MFDLAFRLQILQGPDLVFRRNLGIDAMQLIKIDPVEAQAAKAAFARGSQVFGLPVFDPAIGTRPIETALGGDHKVCRVRVQGLGDDLFTYIWTIGVGGVNEVNPQFDRPP